MLIWDASPVWSSSSWSSHYSIGIKPKVKCSPWFCILIGDMVLLCSSRKLSPWAVVAFRCLSCSKFGDESESWARVSLRCFLFGKRSGLEMFWVGEVCSSPSSYGFFGGLVAPNSDVGNWFSITPTFSSSCQGDWGEHSCKLISIIFSVF